MTIINFENKINQERHTTIQKVDADFAFTDQVYASQIVAPV